MFEQFLGIDISKDSFDIALLESSGDIKPQEKLTMKANLVQLFPKLLNNLNIFTKSILNLLLQAPTARLLETCKNRKFNRSTKRRKI